MAAQAEPGTMIFTGARSLKSYVIDVYLSDVANALVNFAAGAGASATTPTEWRPPEDVFLRDFSVVTGTSDTTKIQLARNNDPTGDILRYSIHLTTLAKRPELLIRFPKGTSVRAMQLA